MLRNRLLLKRCSPPLSTPKIPSHWKWKHEIETLQSEGRKGPRAKSVRWHRAAGRILSPEAALTLRCCPSPPIAAAVVPSGAQTGLIPQQWPQEKEEELVKIPREKKVLRGWHGACPGCRENKPGGRSSCLGWWDKPGRHLSCSFLAWRAQLQVWVVRKNIKYLINVNLPHSKGIAGFLSDPSRSTRRVSVPWSSLGYNFPTLILGMYSGAVLPSICITPGRAEEKTHIFLMQ